MKNFLLGFHLLICSFCFGQKVNKIAIDSFENMIKKDIANKIIAGGTYLLYEKGKVIASNTFGEMDINTHSPLKRTDIFRMASMTKPITTLGLLLLQQDGLININDRLDQYLPEFSNPVVLDKMDTLNGAVLVKTHAAKNPILLRNLLTHSSGFASSFYPSQRALYMEAFKDLDLHDLKHLTKVLSKLPLDFEPGENWQYGPSINVAARVIEVVSGMSFNDFLNKRILGPMQMNDTKFYLDSVDAPRLTSLYTLDSNGKIQLLDPGNESSKLISGPKVFFSGSGGINSTMDDYLKFCIMILNNGDIRKQNYS
jgi:CubicO group peptidase (beta-lactamase class C family)